MRNKQHSRAARARRELTGRRLRWSLMGLALVFSVAFAAASARAQEKEPNEEQKCSDFTPDNRPCTATEEVWFCTENAMDAFEQCKDRHNWVGDIGCMLLYDVDFYMCGAELIVYPLRRALK